MDTTPREQLLLAAINGGLNELIDTASRLLRCPLLLGDTLLNVLAWAGGPGGEGLSWEGYISAGWAPDFLTTPQGGPGPRALPYGFSATPIPNRKRGGWDTLVDLDLGRGISAHLVLSGLEAPQPPETDALIATLCLAIRGLLRADRDAPFRAISIEQFLLQLVHGEEMDEPLLRFRAKLVGLEPEGEFALLLVDLRGYRPVHASISTICARLREALNGPYAIDAETLALLPRGPADGKLWTQAAALLEEYGLEGVRSPWFYRLADAAYQFRRTSQALSLRFCARRGAPLLTADSLSAYLLADNLYRTEGRLAIDQPILLKLVEADKGGKTAYLDTLLAYLESAQHPAAACAALHIHRNTLDYRLRRMEELVPIDWGDGNLMFQLYFGLCCLRYKQLRDL